MINKPAVANYLVNVDADRGLDQTIATSARELIGVLATAAGTALAVRIYDAKTAGERDVQKSILIAANTGESSSFTPAQPMPFKKGISVVFEQGGQAGAEVLLIIN